MSGESPGPTIVLNHPGADIYADLSESVSPKFARLLHRTLAGSGDT